MKNDLFYREFELDRAKMDKEQRSIELSFSSETPVVRWFGSEILLHGEENVDFSRLLAHGSALMNHNPDIIVGRVKAPKVVDKKGRATLIFDDDEDGNKALKKVESGSLKGVSVGYRIERFRDIMMGEEYEGIKGPAMVAIRWAPYEISLTPVPADASVGVGRSLTRSLEGIDIEKSIKSKEEQNMTEEEIRKMIKEELGRGITATVAGIVPEIVGQVRTALADDARPKIRVAGEEYLDLMARGGAISDTAKLKVADMVGEGKTRTEIVNALLDLATGKKDANDTGGGAGGDGTGMDGRNRNVNVSIGSFKQIDDDSFFRGISNPSAFIVH